MDHTGIETFLAIVRHKRLTDAAKSLFISQSALSHRLMQFEKELGVKLIERGRGIRDLSLTSSGEAFLPIAYKWEDLIYETKHLVTHSRFSQLRIGAIDSIHELILPVIYRALKQDLSRLNLRIRTQQSIELYWLLKHGEIDVAFTLLEQPMPNMIMKEFFREAMVVVYRFDEHQKDNLSLSEEKINFDQQFFIDWGSSFRTWYEHWRGSSTISDLKNTQLDTAGLLLTFMNKPGDWAIVPISIARQFRTIGSFDFFQLKDSPPDRICYQIENHTKSSALEGIHILNERIQQCRQAIDAIVQYKI